MKPTVSILITTYNRKELLQRCLSHVLSQTFSDYEVVIIDDCSMDGTEQIIPNNPKIRYYRNEVNQGSVHGDRVHIRRFVNELAQGEYFVYLCDDDYWTFTTLLARQIALFKSMPELAMIIGGQISNFMPQGTRRFHEHIYPKAHMTSDEFLKYFAESPVECNIMVGATLYNREKFIKSGALSSDEGTKWQAGYEMLLAIGCYGDVYYIDQPCIETEIRCTNASFNRTQLEHYVDSCDSVMSAFYRPLIDFDGTGREVLLMDIKKKILHNISQAFLRNAEHIKAHGNLSMCSTENMSRPVTPADVIA